MNSTQKVSLALDRVEGLADDPDAEPAVKMAAAMLALGRPQLARLIPADPDELDVLLAKGAEWMHSLRSDEELELEQELQHTGELDRAGDGPA